MKTIILIIACISAVFAQPPVEFDKEKYKIGEMVFDNKCSSCHEKSMDIGLLLHNFIEKDNKLQDLLK